MVNTDDYQLINKVSIFRNTTKTENYALPSFDGVIGIDKINNKELTRFITDILSGELSQYEKIGDHNLSYYTLYLLIQLLQGRDNFSLNTNGDIEYQLGEGDWEGENTIVFPNYLHILDLITEQVPNLSDYLTKTEASNTYANKDTVSTLSTSVSALNDSVSALTNLIANKADLNHSHALDDLSDVTIALNYIQIGEGEDSSTYKYVELLDSPKQYKTITLGVYPSNCGYVYTPAKVAKGDKTVIIAEPKEGYDFLYWVNNNVSNSPHYASHAHIIVVGDTNNYTAYFTEHLDQPTITKYDFNVTINGLEHGQVSITDEGGLPITSGSVDEGTEITLLITPNAHYTHTISGLPADSTEDSNGIHFTLNSDLNITIAFVAKPKVTVYFGTYVNNTFTKFNTAITWSGKTINGGEYSIEELTTSVSFSPSNITVTGYNFAYWENSQHSRLALADDTLVIDNIVDTSYYAIFTIQLHTLTTYAPKTTNGASIATSDTVTVKVGNVTLTGNNGVYTFNHGTQVIIEAPTLTGYTFANWNKSTSQTNITIGNYSVNGDVEFTPYYSINPPDSYTITATADPTEGGTVSGGGSYSSGAHVTLTAEANTGYHFVEWKENNQQVGTETTYEFDAALDRTLTAKFEKNSYTITVLADPADGGSVEINYEQPVLHGTSVTVTATPETGYKFTKWTSGTSTTSVSNNASYTFTATGDTALTAHFTLKTYSITVNASPTNGGTVSANPATVEHGGQTTLNLTANANYTFAYWKEGDTTLSSNIVKNITSNRTFTAYFTPLNDTIYYFAIDTWYSDDITGVTPQVAELSTTENQKPFTLNFVKSLVILVPSSLGDIIIKDSEPTDITSSFIKTQDVPYDGKSYTKYYMALGGAINDSLTLWK